MTRVELKVLDAGAYAETVRGKLPFAILEKGVVVVRSQLGPEVPLNEHLVWLWGMVQHERRVLKAATSAGARITCECVVPRGPITVMPNGAELLHLLGAELLVLPK
ncbi:hypothetical protein [Piscinibacter gummiphilus]|uniref:Uncharacterized protein n=1 Tax=Piscinibacter gummiphilus TaxID=946333 RepID=A0A1W6LC65_9BURK|nr:hypothetical protein [Piscinibacter gummiphilus]ARN21823.1 hypothetical protein A4W93_19045 [Piscinibacter gummiphilus]ATU66509.1 hypothetical protein CPZ87_19130 [Piscinibacter gummiphilus]GLS95307.1 hypothetical protein GCM10007918_25990 [Piscinibacter gummiphilus]